MSTNSYLIIGALIVVALAVAAIIRAKKAKKTERPIEHIAEPIADPIIPAPDLPAEPAESPFIVGTAPSPQAPAPGLSSAVEIWNQADFRVVATQQELRVTLPPQGRTSMDSGATLTITPHSPADTLHAVSLQHTEGKTLLIVQGLTAH